jgi:polysaccharide export outer membrane protein
MPRLVFLALLLLALQAQTPPPQTQPPQTQPQTAADLVGAQDVLQVTVYNEPQLSGRFKVDAAGEFDYPFLGAIKAGGSTVGQIATGIRGRLADGYVRQPQVTVEIVQYHLQSVFVLGEVHTPGRHTFQGPVVLQQALAEAGSTTPSAGNEVLVLHPKAPTTDASPTLPGITDAEVQRLDLRDVQEGKAAASTTIRDGDTVFVPKAQRFFVTGQVRSPGSYAYEANMTVLQAISIAGGFTERGSDRRMRIVRDKKTLDVKPSDFIQPNDVIVVRTRIL